jgi:hypothetical protein
MARKKKKTLTDADAAEQAERGGRSSGLHIGERRFILKVDSLVQRLMRPLRPQR